MNFSHSSYRNAFFCTGNATTNHQFSIIISTKPDDVLTSEQRIARCLDLAKHYLSNYQMNVIEQNAKAGMHQTVYVIRHKNTRQGIILMNHKGEVLHIWPNLSREININLLNEVAAHISEKQSKSYQHLLEIGRESALMC